MTTILDQHPTGDGYDVRFVASNGQEYTIRFLSKPTKADIKAEIRNFERLIAG
jgi:hypothetical protein